MHKDGHYGVNGLLYAPVLYWTLGRGATDLALYGTVIVVVTATLPDVDVWFDPGLRHRGNILTHLLPIRHRGITHTVWFALGVGLLLGAGSYALGVPGHSDAVVGGFAGAVGVLGVCGHLLGDAFTPRGVAPLEPVSDWRLSLDAVTAGSNIANAGLLFVGISACVLAFGFAVAGASPVDHLWSSISFALFPETA